jgi:C4-type Zn-finger protein
MCPCFLETSMNFKYRLCNRKCFNEYDVIAVTVDSIQKPYFNKVKHKSTKDSKCNYETISGMKTSKTSKSLPQYLIHRINSHRDLTSVMIAKSAVRIWKRNN